MQLFKSLSVSCLLLASVKAHTFVWSVWVNGVDQGTGHGIRHPAYNGPPSPTDPPSSGASAGYANSPVRDLSKIEMRCNVMGEISSARTITVKPNDIVTFEWHHNNRTSADDIIDASHKGSGVVYISPDPPVGDSFVKLQEEGQASDGTWYTGGKLNALKGMQDVRIPAGLAPGFYILRAELLALHEADVAHNVNTNRGIQIYISCVQIQVVGSGVTQLPSGVSFPGAYQYDSPGIVYNIYVTTAGQSYTVPGPAVWTGAAPSPTAPAYGSPTGYTTNLRWSTWIGNGFSVATTATSVTVGAGQATQVYPYSASWSAAYEAPTAVISSINSQFHASDRISAPIAARTSAP